MKNKPSTSQSKKIQHLSIIPIVQYFDKKAKPYMDIHQFKHSLWVYKLNRFSRNQHNFKSYLQQTPTKPDYNATYLQIFKLFEI